MNAIILGATSGIGRELAVVLSQAGYTLGLAGRRVALLESLQAQLSGTAHILAIDVADTAQAIPRLEQLIATLGGLDLLVISSGTGFRNPTLEWEKEKTTLEVNVSGFAAMANVAWRHFERAGRGHLVGISSIAALRGSRFAPAYAASKAFVSNYMEGLRLLARHAKLPITVTDIQPGFVDTAMAQGDGLFWVAPPEKAAKQIYRAIVRRKSHAYVTHRWRLIAWLMRWLPEGLLARM